MTPQTQCLNIPKIALASALHYRHDMVRIPQAAPHARLHSPVEHQGLAVAAARALQLPQRCQRIHRAARTHATVPQKDLLPQISRLRPHLPLMHAIRRAEGKPPRRYLQLAPPADTPPVKPSRHRAAVNPSTLHHPNSAHKAICNGRKHAPQCQQRYVWQIRPPEEPASKRDAPPGASHGVWPLETAADSINYCYEQPAYTPAP